MKKFIIALVGLFLFCPQLASAQQAFYADAKVKVVSTIVAANTTAIVLKSTPGIVYSIDAFNNGGSVIYVKLYNAASATCGSGTPQARYQIPFGATSSGGGFNVSNINGDAYGNGITMCITGGFADADTTNPPATTAYVNVHFK